LAGRDARRHAAELEDALPFQEELPLLGEEDTEACQVDLLLVVLDLGEVGVAGEVRGQALRKADLEIAAEITARLVGAARRADVVGAHVAGEVRLQFERPRGSVRVDTDQRGKRRRLVDAALRPGGRHPRQVRQFVLPAHETEEVDTHTCSPLP